MFVPEDIFDLIVITNYFHCLSTIFVILWITLFQKVEQEVADQIEEWEKQMGREFLVEGVRFLDYIKYQWENYKVQKENEKSQRVSCILLLILLQKQVCWKKVLEMVFKFIETAEIKYVLFFTVITRSTRQGQNRLKRKWFMAAGLSHQQSVDLQMELLLAKHQNKER